MNSDPGGGVRPLDVQGGDDSRRERLSKAAGELVTDRLRFAAPFCIAGLGSFILMTSLAGFSTALDGYQIGHFNLLSILIILHIPMVALLTLVYGRRARSWDGRTAQALEATLGNERHP